MIHMAECSQGKVKGTITYTLFSPRWTKFFDIDLTPKEAQAFFRKKKAVEHVDWHVVSQNSCRHKKLGFYGEQVNSVKELDDG